MVRDALLTPQQKTMVLAFGMLTVILMAISMDVGQIDERNCGDFLYFYVGAVVLLAGAFLHAVAPYLRRQGANIVEVLTGRAQASPPPLDRPTSGAINDLIVGAIICGVFGLTALLTFQTGGPINSPMMSVILVQIILGQLFTRSGRIKILVGAIGVGVVAGTFILERLLPSSDVCDGDGNPWWLFMVISLAAVIVGTLVSLATRTLGDAAPVQP